MARQFTRTEDALRNVEPRTVDDFKGRDGRDFIQDAAPHEGAERQPTGRERWTGTSPIGGKE